MTTRTCRMLSPLEIDRFVKALPLGMASPWASISCRDDAGTHQKGHAEHWRIGPVSGEELRHLRRSIPCASPGVLRTVSGMPPPDSIIRAIALPHCVATASKPCRVTSSEGLLARARPAVLARNVDWPGRGPFNSQRPTWGFVQRGPSEPQFCFSLRVACYVLFLARSLRPSNASRPARSRSIDSAGRAVGRALLVDRCCSASSPSQTQRHGHARLHEVWTRIRPPGRDRALKRALAALALILLFLEMGAIVGVI